MYYLLKNDQILDLPFFLCIFAPAMKYKVRIQETLERMVEVEATSPQEAELAVRQMYHNCVIVLDDSDYVETKIEVQGIAT